MNPQVQQVIDNINQYIVENHNNEITANVLNPILIELANLFDIVGDLSDLTTEDTSSIVNAINELVESISEIAGINKFYGTTNPNQTPPVGYADGDLYFRTASFLGNPYTVYIYNGITWVEIRDPQDLTNEIIQMATPELLSSPTRIKIPNEITQDDEPLPYPIIWKILGVEHQEDNEQFFEINDASENNYRKDLILATQFGTIIKLEGVESEEGVLEPQVPPNMLVLTSITMFGDSVSENPIPPITGSQFIKKANWINIPIVGGDQPLGSLTEITRNFVVNGYSGSGKVTGFIVGLISSDDVYEGQEVIIDNNSEDEIPLEHLANYLGVMPFFFPKEEDYVWKQNERLTFNLRGDFVVLTSSSLGGGGDLELGETSTTAYRGDRGKTAYDHSQTTGNPHQTTLQQVTDEGSTTTNSITVGSGLHQVDINDDGTIDATSNITGSALAARNTDGKLGTIFSDNLTDDREYQLQDKDGTLAHLDDILSDAEDIDYDNTTSGLDAENVQEAVDELNEIKINTSDILDVNDKIKVELLPNSVMELKGQWNAATNTPTLVNGTGNPGDVYEVTVEGAQDFGGSVTYDFLVGDFVVYGADDKWYRSPNTYPTKEVVSVSSNLTLNSTHNGKTLRFTNTLTVTVPSGLAVNFEVFLDNDTVSNNVTFDMSAITTVLAPSGNILVGGGTGYLTMTTTTKVSLKGDFID